jgi:hypothetical protein
MAGDKSRTPGGHRKRERGGANQPRSADRLGRRYLGWRRAMLREGFTGRPV